MNKYMISLVGSLLVFGASHGMAKPKSTSTVALFNSKTGTLCSGVLVARNAVLTAPYCLESTDTLVVFGNELATALNKRENTRRIVKVEWAPQYSPKRPLHQDSKNAALLALIFLDSNAPTGYEPQTLAHTTTKITRGESLTISGYGSDEAARLYQTTVRIEDDKYSLTEFLMTDKASSPSCPGEAGSPLFKGPPKQRVVVGIMAYRRSTLPCHPEAVVTKIAPYRTWIDRKLSMHLL